MTTHQTRRDGAHETMTIAMTAGYAVGDVTTLPDYPDETMEVVALLHLLPYQQRVYRVVRRALDEDECA